MSTKNIYQRINEVLAEGLALPKTGQMTGGATYNFHQTDELLSFLRPILVRHGIAFSYSVEQHECLQVVEGGKFTRTTKAIKMILCCDDNPTDRIEGVEYGYGLDSQDKGPGKATSYAIKTWLLNIFMLRGQPDEDRLDSYDGFIGGETLDEIRELIAKTNADESKLLAVANADRIEHIKLSQIGIVRNLLIERMKKSAKANGQADGVKVKS